MRPTLLKMKAFGCYARETTVNFEEFTSGLYLIVGKTGAGKTTIFDAISFALFGRPSGSERQTSMLHSDFVPKSEDTVVTLDFTHQGRSYHVERGLHFKKTRATGQYDNMDVFAEMTGEGQSPISGAKNVTARCEEMLGLNAEQFRRIVMLAQGEFREFLRSGSDKKNEILGRLFDNTEYVRYQTLLDSVRKKLDDQRRQKNAAIASVMENHFKLPEEERERQSDYLPGHPRLAENLGALVEREEERLRRLGEELKKQRQEKDGLVRREGAVETDNALLHELEEKRAHLAELEAQKTLFQTREREYQAAAKALRRVEPRKREWVRASDSLNRALAELDQQRKRLKEQERVCQEAERLVRGDSDKKIRSETLSDERKKMQGFLSRYDELTGKRETRDKAQRQESEIRRKMEEKEGEFSRLTDSIAALRQELKTLERCEAEVARLEGEKREAERRSEAVSAPEKGLAAQTEGILREEKGLEDEKEKLIELTNKALEAEREYHSLYQAFLGGQAGLIAAEMEKELSESGETVCPVCSTRFRRGEAHCFALPAEHVPDQKAVDEAEKRFHSADQARRDKENKINTNRDLLGQRKEAVLDQMRKLEPACADWAVLTGPGWLEVLCRRLAAEQAEKEAAYGAARENCRRRERLLEEEQKEDENLSELNGQLKESEKALGELKSTLSGLESAIDMLERDLPFPEKQQAEEKITALENEKKALDDEIAEHEKALNEAAGERDRLSGGLKTRQDAMPELRKDAADAEARFRQAMDEEGFAHEAAEEAALAPVRGDGEQWLQTEQKALGEYGSDRETTMTRIGELETLTDGKNLVDLTELQKRLEEAGEREQEAESRFTALDKLLEGHRDVLAQVSKAADYLKRTDRAYKRIDRLASMAVGASGEGGKLSFDRYVMAAVFREVLALANYRLSIMTGGRFELIHNWDAARRNSVGGLEIDVMDLFSGGQRPSGSISGGEGFMVSLALALGLSDVVQNHAGGQKLDTLFIDEGFGTLDDGKLENVITVLKQLTEGNRLVGVISHVDKVEESIPHKLRVTSTDKGSTLVTELR